MPKFSEMKTKTAKVAYLREKLKTDDRWIARGLLAIYRQQTPGEQRKKRTQRANDVGFSRYDAPELSRAAVQLRQRGGRDAAYDLSSPFILAEYIDVQLLPVVRYRMQKYAGQLLGIVESRQK